MILLSTFSKPFGWAQIPWQEPRKIINCDNRLPSLLDTLANLQKRLHEINKAHILWGLRFSPIQQWLQNRIGDTSNSKHLACLLSHQVSRKLNNATNSSREFLGRCLLLIKLRPVPMISFSYPSNLSQTPHLISLKDPNWISKLIYCLLHLHVTCTL